MRRGENRFSRWNWMRGTDSHAGRAICCLLLALSPLLHAQVLHAQVLHAQRNQTILVAKDSFLNALKSRIPAGFRVMPRSKLDQTALIEDLAEGGSMVWIGSADGIPPDLSVGAFQPSRKALRISADPYSPLPIAIPIREAIVSSAFIKPPKELPYHNIDEEQRADFLPIFQATDPFGKVIGYPGVLMRYSTSFLRRRFRGAECFFFLFADPENALDRDTWGALLDEISLCLQGGLQIGRLTSGYASYPTGERVRISARLLNRTSEAAAGEVRFSVRAPGETTFREFDRQRRVADGRGESEAVSDFTPARKRGLWTIRADLYQDPLHARELAVEGKLRPVDRRTISIVVLDGNIRTPSIVQVRDAGIEVAGEKGFWAGTNYYPSSSWWEWLWRDFRPLEADQDFAAMRRAGYRIVRIWIDPILETQTMRAMDAAVYLAAQHGIVLDVCLFTQWVRTLGFEKPGGERVRFDFRGPRDFNIYGISFRNLALQREYVRTLAARWRAAGNVIYDLSNETYVKDPDASQMDAEAQRWQGIPKGSSVLRDTLLFRRWADGITSAIRKAGGRQPIIPGYLFSELAGGDAYLAQSHGDIAAWHSYADPQHTANTLSYMDPMCSGRPLLLEEFGTTGWNHPEYYDAIAHAALGAGAAGAMSYEWGIRWLAPEISYYPTPLRESLGQTPDPRWFGPALDLVKKWPSETSGINPTPSGFYYGSIYSGTPFPAAAASALGRAGLIGTGLARRNTPETTYVVIPAPSDKLKENMHVIGEVLDRLRARGASFGVIHEDCLDHLPSSARVLICPVPIDNGRVRRRSLRIVSTAESAEDDIPRLRVQPDDHVQVMTRHTASGTLYTFLSDKSGENRTVRVGSQTIRFRLDRLGLIEQRPSGAGMIEAAGEVTIDGSFFCAIEGTRVVLKAPAGSTLTRADRLSMVAYGPGQVRFARRVRAISVIEPGQKTPVGILAIGSYTVELEDTMAAYTLQVEF
jgi:hypothetical protein